MSVGSSSLPGFEHYLAQIQALQVRVINTQRDTLRAVAAQMATTIAHERRILLFGTGHSHMLAEEGFLRAGGLAAVVPIFLSGLMLHENVVLGGRLERLPGLAAPLLDQFAVEADEMLFVFSNSGVNQLPVEMAMLARARGLHVVGVLARAYAQLAPLSALGKRLDEVVDYVIDNGGLPGDALLPLGEAGGHVAPSSTVMGAFLWNCLVAEAALELQRLGIQVPLLVSGNLPGAEAHNQALLRKWAPRNPYLASWVQRD